MSNDAKPSAPVSDTMSADQPATNLSETEYLAREAQQARAAFNATLDQMRASLKDIADVRAWARRYPWATLGVAAAAGFVAAKAVIPKGRHSPEDTEPALLEKILSDEKIAARIKELAEQEEGHRSGAGMMQSVGMTLLRTFGPAVQSAITAALAAKAAQPNPEDVGPQATAAEMDQAASDEPLA